MTEVVSTTLRTVQIRGARYRRRRPGVVSPAARLRAATRVAGLPGTTGCTPAGRAESGSELFLQECVTVVTGLDKALKRKVSVDDLADVVALDPEGIMLTQKGKRRPEVELRWREPVTGEAAMAVALNASLAARPAAVSSAFKPASAPASASPAPAAPAAAMSGMAIAPTPKNRAVRKPR